MVALRFFLGDRTDRVGQVVVNVALRAHRLSSQRHRVDARRRLERTPAVVVRQTRMCPSSTSSACSARPPVRDGVLVQDEPHVLRGSSRRQLRVFGMQEGVTRRPKVPRSSCKSYPVSASLLGTPPNTVAMTDFGEYVRDIARTDPDRSPGFDLTVAAVYEVVEPGRIDFGGGELKRRSGA